MFPLVQVKYNAYTNSRVSVYSIPLLLPCPFLLLQFKNLSIQSQNVVHSSLFVSLSLCFQLHGRTCRYGNQSTLVLNQVNLSSPIAKQSNRESKLSMELPEVMNSSPLFSLGLTNIRQKDTSLVPQAVQERKFRMSFSKSYQWLSLLA